MKLVVGIALATKRAVNFEEDEVPEAAGGPIGIDSRLSGGRRGKHQGGEGFSYQCACRDEGGCHVILPCAECPRP